MKIIKESPDVVMGEDPKYHYYKKIAKHDDKGSYAFGIADGEMHISNEGSTHTFLLPSKRTKELYKIKKTRFARLIFDYTGRIWTDQKIISFWIYPPTKNELKNIIHQIEEQFKLKHNIDINIWNDSDFKIEVNNEMDLPDSLSTDSSGQWSKFSEKSMDLIPLSDFMGSKDTSPEEMRAAHTKGNRKWIPGWGSDKQWREKPLAWRQALVFETLEESINSKKGIVKT